MQEITPEFSRIVAADRLGSSENIMKISANEAECAALAERFSLISINSLSADLSLRRIGGSELVRLKGRLTADVVQSCVITLDPVPEHVEEEFELIYGPEEAAADEEDMSIDVILDAEAEDPPEPMQNGMIDVGEAVAEHLALALDPFPRAPGAELPTEYRFDPEAEASEKPNPFAVLASLRKKEG